MLRELAIMPGVFDSNHAGNDPEHALELRELLRELAMDGLVANLDKGEWARQVMAHADNWPPPKREAVKRYLSRLDDLHRFVRHPKRMEGHPEADMEWFALALKSHHRLPFDWMVVSPACRNPAAEVASEDGNAVTDLSELRQLPQWENRRWSPWVRMCESEYCRLLAPLLRHAKRLEIVDPYLSYRNARQFKLVEICANLLGRRAETQLNGEIHIHTSQEPESSSMSVDDYLDRWIDKLSYAKRRLRSPHAFKVVVWRAVHRPQIHDRYLLTDQCGVSVPWGFGCNPEDTVEKTTWNLLDPEAWKEKRGDYIRDVGPFQWLGERTL